MRNDSQNPVRPKHAGGVRAAELTPVTNLSDVSFDDGSGWNGCTLADRTRTIRCTLLEDRSSFEERFTVEDGIMKVTHTLRLVSDRNFAADWLEADFIDDGRNRGFAAAITLGDGRICLVGYSKKFKAEQPLLLKSQTVLSGEKPLDAPTVELLLESVDTSPAAIKNR